MTDDDEYDIEIARDFDAPARRVYEAFTVPDQFARWYGPVGFPVSRDSVDIDARVGGLADGIGVYPVEAGIGSSLVELLPEWPNRRKCQRAIRLPCSRRRRSSAGGRRPGARPR